VLVPDRALAEYLHHLFPGSRLEPLDVGLPEEIKPKPGRPRKHGSGKERVAEHRRRDREKQIEMLNGLLALRAPDANGPGRCKEDERESCNENTIELITHSVTQLTSGTLYPSKNSSYPFGYLNTGSEMDLIEFLRSYHQMVLPEKEKSLLFSPAVFDPKLVSGKRRGPDNIIYLRHLWLDFENGDLNPEEFPELFPHIRMVVTNTFRHTRREPRYRVIIPTTQPMTSEVYAILYESIAFKLEEAGYDVPKKRNSEKVPGRKRSGLDWAKRAPVSLFNLPSQAGDATQSFFHVHTEEGRSTLDPAMWVENSGFLIKADVDPVPPPRDRNESVNQKDVEAAIDRWRGARAHPGEGNNRFYAFARELRSAGMDMFEIETTLRSEAPFSRSPSERKAQIPGIMNSLRRGRGR
jgi:hypothetical protein